MSKKDWEIVIGLEIHVELATKTKIFCSCTTKFGGKPNSHCCPICMGLPGTLPVLNEKVLEYAVKAGLALNCEITEYNKFDRKNYYYPDLPKAYQISQLYLPFAADGRVDIQTEKGEKSIKIHEIHMEEDAGKLIHSDIRGESYPDYNRCGVPLLEIVSEPDFRNSEEVIAYLEKIKLIFEYLEISDCKMEEGSMRADINLSVRRTGDELFGKRTETKNLNSFRAIKRAIEYESHRQIELLERGRSVIQQTRRWDDDANTGYAMRNKENADDYRYFPEPDIPPILLTGEYISNIKNNQPELADEKKRRYIKDYGLSDYDAAILTTDKILADFFERTVKESGEAKEAANWLIVHAMRLMKDNKTVPKELKFCPVTLAGLIKIIGEGKVNRTVGYEIFEMIFNVGDIDIEKYISEKNLGIVGDISAIRGAAIRIIAASPDGVKKYKAGKTKVLGAFVGQIMREFKGKADPDIVNEIVLEEIEKN